MNPLDAGSRMHDTKTITFAMIGVRRRICNLLSQVILSLLKPRKVAEFGRLPAQEAFVSFGIALLSSSDLSNRSPFWGGRARMILSGHGRPPKATRFRTRSKREFARTPSERSRLEGGFCPRNLPSS